MISIMGRDPIAILTFLETYKTSCDNTCVEEGLEVQILPYVLDGQPKFTHINYRRQPQITYPKTINFLLTNYATNETIIQNVDTIKNMSPLPNQHASDFADYVRYRTNRCERVYQPIHQIEFFLSRVASPIR